MIKLYRQSQGKFEYWEAWNHRRVLTVHWGEVGTRGEVREVTLKPSQRAQPTIAELTKAMQATGFAEIDIDQHDVLIVQYKIGEVPTEADVERRHAIEALLNEEIGWLGAGMVDGGDIGQGEMNVFAFVVDGPRIADCVVGILREHEHLDGAVIAVRRADEEDEAVVWPKGFTGEFRVL